MKKNKVLVKFIKLTSNFFLKFSNSYFQGTHLNGYFLISYHLLVLSFPLCQNFIIFHKESFDGTDRFSFFILVCTIRCLDVPFASQTKIASNG